MIAPSEKHLENWLVDNPDRIPFNSGAAFLRQYALPSGIADFIFLDSSYGALIVELKKGAIDSKTFAQAIRYIHDVREIAKVALDLIRPPSDYVVRSCDPDIGAILVGHSLADDNLLIVADVLNIDICLYDYDRDSDVYEFEWLGSDKTPLLTRYEYAQGELGKAIQTAFLAEYELFESNPEVYLGLKAMTQVLDVFILETEHGVKASWSSEK